MVKIVYQKDAEGEKIQFEGTTAAISEGIAMLIKVFTAQVDSTVSKTAGKPDKNVEYVVKDEKKFEEAWNEFSKQFFKEDE